MLGKDDWKKFMGNIQLALKTGNKPLAAIRKDVRAAYVDDAGKFNLSEMQESDEIAAKVVEQAVDADGNFRPGFGFVKSVYAKVVEFLRGIGINVKMTMAELQGALVNAQRFLEVGKRTAGSATISEPAFSFGSESPIDFIESPPEETKVRAVQRVSQDKFNRFNVVREWAEENGIKTSDLSNVWEAEERMHGRIATRVEDFREKTVKPVIEKIQKAGFDIPQVAEFLHAQHAEERNRQIESVDQSLKDGSGMTTEAAQKILDAAPEGLADVANEFRKITDNTKDLMLKSGVLSQEMADAWDAAYKHYVPLKGDGKGGRQGGTGAGLSVKNTNKRALGHGERSEFIFENILRDHERAIMLAEKNMVGQSLLAMALELNRPDIISIDKPEKRKVLRDTSVYRVATKEGTTIGTFASLEGANRFIADQKSVGLTVGKVKGDPVAAYMASPMLQENEVQIYARGHTIRMQLHDELMARAYKNMGSEQLGVLMRVNREINNGLSRAYTAWNPEFLLANIARDFSTGLINITGKEGLGVALKAVLGYPQAFGKVLFNKDNESVRLYREHGGSTGAAYLSDIERIGKDVKSTFDDYQGVVELARSGNAKDAAVTAARKVFVNRVIKLIEKLNGAGENAMRVSVFDVIRKTPGRTLEQAASVAKNATVNFNRRGEVGSQLSALYIFGNPAVQGAAITVETLTKSKHKHQAQALASAMAVTAYSLLSMSFAGDGDEDEWEAIPDHIKDRNLIIRTGEKSYVTIPAPYGFGFFHQLGVAAFDLQRGADIDKVSLRLASGLITHFGVGVNPLNGDQVEAGGFIELIPGLFGGELMRASVRMAANRSGLGGTIVPESPFDDDKPDRMRMFRTTKGTTYDKAAGVLGDSTGGSATQPGLIDVSPETLKYWTQTIAGGAGKFTVDAIDAGILLAQSQVEQDQEKADALRPEVREIPFVRKFYRKEDIRDLRGRFWEQATAVDSAEKAFRRAIKSGDADAAQEVFDENEPLISLGNYLQAQKKMVKRARDYTDELMASDQYSDAEKRLMVRDIEGVEGEIYSSFLELLREQKRTATAESPKAQ